MAKREQISLFTKQGKRKYLNQTERQKFYNALENLPLDRRLFCELLYYTGGRIGEVLELSPGRIDFAAQAVTFRTLKQRRNDVYRQVPLPSDLLKSLASYIRYNTMIGKIKSEYHSLWPFKPRTAYKMINDLMCKCGFSGANASAKALRHAFAIHSSTIVPLTQVQIWMGHSDLETTAIYLQASGIEERRWAEKMWADMGHSSYSADRLLSKPDYRNFVTLCLSSWQYVQQLQNQIKSTDIDDPTVKESLNNIKSTLREMHSMLFLIDELE